MPPLTAHLDLWYIREYLASFSHPMLPLTGWRFCLLFYPIETEAGQIYFQSIVTLLKNQLYTAVTQLSYRSCDLTSCLGCSIVTAIPQSGVCEYINVILAGIQLSLLNKKI